MLHGDLRNQVDMYDAARMFHPAMMRLLDWDADTVRQKSQHVPFLRCNPPVVTNLCKELKKYKTLIIEKQIDRDGDVEEWWCAAEFQVPNWFFGATNMMLHQPSSASVERMFSMLKAIMGDNQQSALQDYQCAVLMCRYNQLMRRT